MPRVVFVASGPRGAAELRGHQVVRSLRAQGVDAVVRPPSRAADELRDAIVVFVKMLPVAVAERLRARGNRLVLDWIDPHHATCVLPDGSRTRLDRSCAGLLSGILCVNSSLVPSAEALLPGGAHRCILHAWDRRCRRYLPRPNRFSLVFFGHSGYRDPVRDVTHLVLAEHRAHLRHFVRLSRFTCHLVVRDPYGQHEAEADGDAALAYWSKSNIKLSTAAAYAANVIATPDPAVRDLLDPDYPYLTTAATDDVADTVERARDDYGNATWRRGLEQIRAVRERTRPDRIALDYLAYLRELTAA